MQQYSIFDVNIYPNTRRFSLINKWRIDVCIARQSIVNAEDTHVLKYYHIRISAQKCVSFILQVRVNKNLLTHTEDAVIWYLKCFNACCVSNVNNSRTWELSFPLSFTMLGLLCVVEVRTIKYVHNVSICGLFHVWKFGFKFLRDFGRLFIDMRNTVNYSIFNIYGV